MSASNDSRPQLLRPLVQRDEHLTIVREHKGRAHQAVEHPHCEEHFLFTPHCAACIEAEKTQYARVQASRIERPNQAWSKPSGKPPQSSRSFGFTDSLPYSLTHEPTFAEHAFDWFTRPSSYPTSNTDGTLIDLLLDI